MSTPGLSLVGFMTDQQQAIQHLRVQCVPSDPSDAALIKEWDAAKAKRGYPVGTAGSPYVLPIPQSDAGYIQQLMQQPWVQEALRMFGYAQAEFKLVEIEPLLAYQFIVDADRSKFHCGGLSNPSVSELMKICLPQAQPKPIDLSPLVDLGQSHCATIKSRNLSMRQMNRGIFGLNQNGYESWVAGMQIHVTLPFVHVVRLNKRYYLHNGFHRAYGARLAGAKNIPCLLRDVQTPQEAGIMDGQTFPLTLLESGDPPTIGHFTQGRAYDVRLRAVSRLIHVTWTESVVLDE